MADQKFTPGPWYARRTMPGQVREENYIDIVNVQMGKLSDYANGWLVAEIDAEHPVDDANARLIAKAPELYEALKGIEWRGIYGGDLSCLFCYSFETDGHMSDCEWQALIAQVDGTP